MPLSPHFLGFTSIVDFIKSAAGLTHLKINVAAAGLFTIASATIGTYIWESPTAVYTLWALMGSDYVTGIIKSIKDNTFRSARLWRMPIYFIVTTLLLSLSFWMGKGQAIFTYLPSIVIGGFYSTYFLSIIENLGDLNLLPAPMVKILKNRFGIETLVNKFKDEKDEKDEKDK